MEKGRSVVRPKSINNITYDFLERYIVVYIVNLGFLCNDFVIGVLVLSEKTKLCISVFTVNY